MCLLDEVLRYDEHAIRCRVHNHRDAAHPLREAGVLPSICAVEYAAQAMAVHGALLGSRSAHPGVLAGLRDVTLHVQRLDDIDEDLIITAEKLWAEDTRLLYAFTVCAGKNEIVAGRATVIIASQPSRSGD